MAYQAIPPVSSGGSGSPISSNGTWARAQYTLISGLVPSLTAYQYLKAGEVPMGGTLALTNDGAVEGAGRTSTNATFTGVTASVFQAIKTTAWAFAFRVRFLGAGAGQSNAVGLVNSTASHDVLIGAINSISGTNYSLALDGATSTSDDLGVANDLGFHTFVVVGNTTNVLAYVDGTLRGTRAIGTNLVDEPLYLCTFNSASSETVWTEALYAYIAV